MPRLRSISLRQRSFELIFSSIVPSFTLKLVAHVIQGQSLAKAPLGGAPPPNFSELVQGFKKNVDAVQASYPYFLGAL